MANRLGATFFRCAMGPVSYAGQCIMAGRVKEGLAELARDGLMGAWQRGVSDVASGAGTAVADVEGLLPRDEVQAAADLLHESQKRAAEAWQTYAGHLGGLLAGIADLTVDGRVPEASLCLERLADKVARDKPLAEPLRLLAVDTQRWQDMIFDCKRRLEDGHALAAAFRRRRAMRLGAVGLAAALIAASVGAVGVAAVTRARVDRTLAAAVGPCDVDAIPADTLARASSEQRVRIEGLRSTCASEKAARRGRAARCGGRRRRRRPQPGCRQSARRRATSWPPSWRAARHPPMRAWRATRRRSWGAWRATPWCSTTSARRTRRCRAPGRPPAKLCATPSPRLCWRHRRCGPTPMP
ncbi:MAG: hypothetical protein WKG00_31850 [Polyangiaceae bacterium]